MTRDLATYGLALGAGFLGAFALSFVRGYRLIDEKTGDVVVVVREPGQAGLVHIALKKQGKDTRVLDALGRDITTSAILKGGFS
jgi:hypothetical protein